MLKKSQERAPNNLSDYDRKAFVDQLTDTLLSKNPFVPDMQVLQGNREIRKYAIPAYLLGAMLHLHLARLNLYVKQATTPVDSTDIQEVMDLADSYAATFPELEEDYVGLCKAKFVRYPLLDNFAGVDREDLTTAWATPEPSEGIALAKTCINKWLQGNRMMIAKTMEQIEKFKPALASAMTP